MTDYQSALKHFESELLRGYNDGKMIDYLTTSPYEADKPVRSLMRYGKLPQAKALMPGEKLVDDAPLTFEEFKPFLTGYKIDLRRVREDFEFFVRSNYLYVSGINMAEREYYAIVDSMLKNNGFDKSIKKSELQKKDFNDAIEAITSKRVFPWDMLIDRKNTSLLDEDFIARWNYPQNALREASLIKNFIGKFKWLNVFHAPFLSNKIVFFDKHEIQTVTTKVKMYYDIPEHPSVLFIEKFVTSAPTINDAVSILTLTD